MQKNVLAQKGKKAREWGVKMVCKQWLIDIIEGGYFLDECDYWTDGTAPANTAKSSEATSSRKTKNSTPLKSKQPAAAFSMLDPNFRCHSVIYKF